MNVLEEAAGLVNGERQEHYGHPVDNHGCTAEMWTAYLRTRGLLADGVVVDGHDVCMLNSLQKHSREANFRKRDNLVDIAGFVLNAQMVDEGKPDDQEPFTPETVFWHGWDYTNAVYAMTRSAMASALSYDDAWVSVNPADIRPEFQRRLGEMTLFGFPVRFDFGLTPGTFELRKDVLNGAGWETVAAGPVE